MLGGRYRDGSEGGAGGQIQVLGGSNATERGGACLAGARAQSATLLWIEAHVCVA